MNPLVIAYLGDAVYELEIRKHLIQSISKSKDIQIESLKYVSAKSQKIHLDRLIKDNTFTKEEIEIIKRGRNAKGGKSKSTDIVTYRWATGLETLFGELYLNNNNKRIDELIERIVSR